jgi:hypothetical protein
VENRQDGGPLMFGGELGDPAGGLGFEFGGGFEGREMLRARGFRRVDEIGE